MGFRYYYATGVDGQIKMDSIGHIKIPNIAEAFFCGATKPDRYEVREWALPGRALCPKCVSERERLEAGRPTPHQVATWWQGGRVAHEKEMEALR